MIDYSTLFGLSLAIFQGSTPRLVERTDLRPIPRFIQPDHVFNDTWHLLHPVWPFQFHVLIISTLCSEVGDLLLTFKLATVTRKKWIQKNSTVCQCRLNFQIISLFASFFLSFLPFLTTVGGRNKSSSKEPSKSVCLFGLNFQVIVTFCNFFALSRFSSKSK